MLSQTMTLPSKNILHLSNLHQKGCRISLMFFVHTLDSACETADEQLCKTRIASQFRDLRKLIGYSEAAEELMIYMTGETMRGSQSVALRAAGEEKRGKRADPA